MFCLCLGWDCNSYRCLIPLAYGSELPRPLLLFLLAAGAMFEATIVMSFTTLLTHLVRDHQLVRVSVFLGTTRGLVFK